MPTANARPAADASPVVLAEGVLRLLSVARCLAVVEDLHWADRESLDVLAHVADHIGSEPAVLLATLRADEDTAAVVLARELASRGVATRLDLARLGPAATVRMAAGCLGLPADADPPAEVVALLERSAAGLPLLVEDLLAAAARDGGLREGADGWQATGELRPGRPLTFTDTVARRLAGLSPDAVAVVQAAAVLGTSFPWRLLPAVTGRPQPVVLDALRAARASGLVVTEGAGFAFRHALTGAAVLDGLLPPERAAVSARAAEVVTAAHPDPDGPASVLAADLFAAAGDDVAAARMLLRAGRRALADGALAGAVALLDRAAALATPDPELAAGVAFTLLEAVSATGDAERTAAVGRTALDALTARSPAPDAARRVEAHLLVARGLLDARPDAADEALAQARRAAGGDAVAQARVDGPAALAALRSERPDRVEAARALASRAVAAAEAAGLHEVACEALEVIGRCARMSDLDAAEAAFARQLQVAKVGGLPLWRIRARNELGTITWLRHADPRGVQAAHDDAVAAGAPLLAAGYAIDLGVFHAFLADYDRAEAVAVAVHATAQRFGSDGLATTALVVRAMAAAHRGRRAAAEELIARIGPAAGGDLAVAVWGICRLMLALVEEDRAAALHAVERAEEAMRRTPALMGDPFSGIGLVVRLVSGEPADLAVLDRHAPGSVLHRLCGGVARAVVAGRAGRADEARRELASAMTVTQATLYRQLLLRLAAEAALADGWGDPAGWLAEVEAWASRPGHDRVARECRRLLRQAGVVVGRGGAAEAAVPTRLRRLGVTAREAEVLELLGARLTDREIGARLHLSSRTVEKHVASLRAKLGVGSRRQLGSAAEADG